MEQELYDQLAFYTLGKHDSEFIHQHIVDAFAAQTASETTKPITVVFALAGLYLHLEKGFTGRQVQLAHMRMAKGRRTWPRLLLPLDRGAIRVADVLQVEPGPALDRAIEDWCASVWAAYGARRGEIAAVLKVELDIG